ncbi:hypothetical protein OPV22_004929 [Ensete ventricosum]|uniref:Fructose-1-6-bisphosphatase class I N-terminal domain-containing protein n=1 Tax=Ensete ventricosum TaxID=4639 RepID=A0AAV8RPZ6_ENSVE|nr:hypothetical protein OPV22_004929 [Ensete ventricosum]
MVVPSSPREREREWWRRGGSSRGDFTNLLSHIGLGCKFVCSAVNKAGLAKLIGLARETNDQGEEQKKLDVLFQPSVRPGFDEQWRHRESPFLIRIRSASQCILVSEEDEEALTFVDPPLRGRYCVVSDPLDGSSIVDWRRLQ